LQESIMQTPGAVPRVSQYRLAAHLGTALILYAGMFATGLAVLRDLTFVRSGNWSGFREFPNQHPAWELTLKHPKVIRFKTGVWATLALVFVTAMSGAFVAGLDAGLVYNEFPTMGGRLVPPTDELFSRAYTKLSDASDWWRNLFENPTTVQFNHRVLATTTYFTTCTMYFSTHRLSIMGMLPPLTNRLALATFVLVNAQALFGIATLLYLVPVPIAATHQAGSVALLTSVLALLISLRRPGQLARICRKP